MRHSPHQWIVRVTLVSSPVDKRTPSFVYFYRQATTRLSVVRRGGPSLFARPAAAAPSEIDAASLALPVAVAGGLGTLGSADFFRLFRRLRRCAPVFRTAYRRVGPVLFAAQRVLPRICCSCAPVGEPLPVRQKRGGRGSQSGATVHKNGRGSMFSDWGFCKSRASRAGRADCCALAAH